MVAPGGTLLTLKPPLHLETHSARWFGRVLLGAACLGNVFSWSGERNSQESF